jgi:hypothetical protein
MCLPEPARLLQIVDGWMMAARRNDAVGKRGVAFGRESLIGDRDEVGHA